VRAARIAVAALAAALAAAPAASASNAVSSGNTLVYMAGGAEANNVSISQSGLDFTIADSAAAIAPGAGCAAVNANTVTCAALPGFETTGVEIFLADQADVATVSDTVDVAQQVFVYGGSENDRLIAGGGTPHQLFGEAGEDELIGGANSDQLDGGTENDNLQGGPGNDYVPSNPGNDEIRGGPGFDQFEGDSTPDGADTIDGGADRDAYYLNSRTADLTIDQDGVADDGEGCPGPGCENDNVLASVEGIVGGAGNDVLLGGPGPNYLSGNGGDDVAAGGGGADQLRGDPGEDLLSGDAGDDSLGGGEGPDRLLGGGGDDELEPELFDHETDVLSGGRGTDSARFVSDFGVRVDLDNQADDGISSSVVDGPRDNARSDIEDLIGGGGPDLLVGNSRANQLDGGDGSDRLLGNGGPDGLLGGRGSDSLTGGRGRDSFDGGAGPDRIRARDNGPDEIACGADIDRVKADRVDRAGADCERVARP
jgi:Ca2+-binding RTX toxin-like protein